MLSSSDGIPTIEERLEAANVRETAELTHELYLRDSRTAILAGLPVLIGVLGAAAAGIGAGTIAASVKNSKGNTFF